MMTALSERSIVYACYVRRTVLLQFKCWNPKDITVEAFLCINVLCKDVLQQHESYGIITVITRLIMQLYHKITLQLSSL